MIFLQYLSLPQKINRLCSKVWSASSQYTPAKLLYTECYQEKKNLFSLVNILLYDCSITKNWLTLPTESTWQLEKPHLTTAPQWLRLLIAVICNIIHKFKWGMNHLPLPTLISVHSSLCRQRFSLKKKKVSWFQVLLPLSISAARITSKYRSLPTPQVNFFISSRPSQQTLPLVKASFSPLLTYPFWQLCSLPHTFHSNNLILLSRTAIILFSLRVSKSPSVLARTNICHTQKPTKADRFYRKGCVSQHQTDSKT